MKKWLFFAFLLVSTQNIFSSDSEDSSKENNARSENEGYGQYSEIDDFEDEISRLFTSSISLTSLLPEVDESMRSSSRAATDSRATDNQSPTTIADCQDCLSSFTSFPSRNLSSVTTAAADISDDENKTPSFLSKSSAFSAMNLKKRNSAKAENHVEVAYAEKLYSKPSPRTASRSGAKSVTFKDELIESPTEKEVKNKKVEQSIEKNIKEIQDRNVQEVFGKKSRRTIAVIASKKVQDDKQLEKSLLGKRYSHGASAAGPVQDHMTFNKESLGKRSFYGSAAGIVKEGEQSQKKSEHQGTKRSFEFNENLDSNKKNKKDSSSDSDTDLEL